MRPIDADVLKQHIDKLPALPDGNFAGNHSALKALINMQPTIEPSTNCSEFPNNSDAVSRQAAIDAINKSLSRVFTEPCGEQILKGVLSAQPEPSIPLSWIEKYIEWLKSFDNEFVNLAAAHISVMVKKWRDEKK